jgi:DNA-binding NarL/FixJ family response regulator
MLKRRYIQKCRVLLVDDHERIRDALRKLLAFHEDIEIIGEAGDGKQAIELVAACRPDVVLMDIYMPKMNGIQASGMIMKSWEDTIIIGLCVVQDTYTTEAFLKAGALAVVSKERIEDLYSMIQRACENRRTSDAA